jgi:protein-S-isoprenylcysteine O-methyltransferase Ste14
MNTARYWVALYLVAMVPGATLYRFSIHPLIRFWRRVGPRRTLAIHLAATLLLAAAIFMLRRPLLAVEFGTNPMLIAVAIPLFALSIAGRILLGRQLKNTTLLGVPELAAEPSARRLITEGVYSRVRHPRYLQMVVALLALALFTNYLATYVLVLLFVLALFPLTRIEERELRERFGAEYEAYCARVPRFIPRL